MVVRWGSTVHVYDSYYTIVVNSVCLSVCFLFQYFLEKLKGSSWNHDFENFFSVAAMAPNLIMFLLNTLFKHK